MKINIDISSEELNEVLDKINELEEVIVDGGHEPFGGFEPMEDQFMEFIDSVDLTNDFVKWCANNK